MFWAKLSSLQFVYLWDDGGGEHLPNTYTQSPWTLHIEKSAMGDASVARSVGQIQYRGFIDPYSLNPHQSPMKNAFIVNPGFMYVKYELPN